MHANSVRRARHAQRKTLIAVVTDADLAAEILTHLGPVDACRLEDLSDVDAAVRKVIEE